MKGDFGRFPSNQVSFNEPQWHRPCCVLESRAARGAKMKIKCISCGRDVNLDHRVFEDYEGPVKCFSCSTMMEMKTMRGLVDSLSFVRGIDQARVGAPVRQNVGPRVHQQT
jgi:ribosomal protein S27E